MLKSNAPTQLTVAFASGAGAGPINAIPIPASGTAGGASWTTGFTAVNMEPIGSGGIPPFGADFNGIFNALSNAQIWEQAGYLYPYSSAFSTAVGGYPAGASLAMASGLGLWINQSDSNTTNPDTTASANWVELCANGGATSLALSGASVTPTANQLGVRLLILTGALSAACKLVLPLRNGASWKILNNTTGGQTVTVGGATGSTVTIAAGSAGAQEVFTDGTNYYTTSFNGSGVYLPINGNAVSASKWANARAIAMTGDVAWSVSVDGSADATAVGTIQAGAVTLAKMANLTASTLLGNPTASAATPVAIPLINGIVFNAGSLGLGAITPVSVNAAGNVQSGGQLLGLTTTPLGNASGNFYIAQQLQQSTATTGGNNISLVVQNGRTAAGTDWTATNTRIFRQVDSTAMGFVQFGETASGTGLALGSGSSTYLTMSGAGLFTFAGQVIVNSTVTAQQFISTTTSAILATSATGGQIVLRPNGAASATGQLVLDTGGNASIPGSFTAGANLVGSTNILSSTAFWVASGNASASNVTFFFRPGGSSVSTLQTSTDSGGNWNFGASITAAGNVNSSQNFASTGTAVVLATTGAGTVYLRPNGIGSTTGQFTVDQNGNLISTGTSVNFNVSDVRVKTNFVEREPACLHRLWFGDYDRTDIDAHGVGHKAQDVQTVMSHRVLQNPHYKVPGTDDDMLIIDQAGMALEQGVWCGREIDKLWATVREIEARVH